MVEEKRSVAFLLMPFAPELDDLRRDIVAAGDAVGVEVIRADDIFRSGVIIEQIKEQIRNADAIIAVCTSRNPNVFYELGIADSGHVPILVAEKTEDLPFDIHHFRAQFYGGATPADSRKTLGQRLGQALIETLAAPRRLDGPAISLGHAARDRTRLADRLRGTLGAMTTYTPADLARFGHEVEPLMVRYLQSLAGLIDTEVREHFRQEARAFARFGEQGLGPGTGPLVLIEMPQWVVWWLATACGIYAAWAERWWAIRVLSEQVFLAPMGGYRPLTLLDPGDGGQALASQRFTNQLEQGQYGRIAPAYQLVRVLQPSSFLQAHAPDLSRSEEVVWRHLAVYVYLVLLRALQDSHPPPQFPWVYVSRRLAQFVERLNHDRALRSELSNDLFRIPAPDLDKQLQDWQAALPAASDPEYQLPRLKFK